jgi:hypothetical protein
MEKNTEFIKQFPQKNIITFLTSSFRNPQAQIRVDPTKHD